MKLPTIADVRNAAKCIAPYIHQTPVLTCSSINAITGASIFFKCENFQKVGAFKARGASYAALLLSDEQRKNGLATHSSGNHAQAVAYIAQKLQIPAYIVMPNNSPKVKIAAVKEYGAQLIFCGNTIQDREQTVAEVVKNKQAHFIHPYNNQAVIAGQGTAALELLQAQPHLDYLLAPIGGGGLVSGTAITTKAISPSTVIIGIEPALASDAYLSVKSGKIEPQMPPITIADGLRTNLGNITFACIQQYVDDIVIVSEQSIIAAMKMIWQRMKIIIEPSCAVPLAAILEQKIEVKGKKVGIILTGGNVDVESVSSLFQA
jgi:threonine dehydratase